MKKVLFSLLSASALLCSTSCSEEAVVPAVAEDAVSFSVALDGANGSRAINDGLNATELYYEVYSTTGTGENLKVADAPLAEYDQVNYDFNGNANISLNLAKKQTYYIVFWAQAPDAYDASNLRAIDVNTVYTNAASKDAFTAVRKFTVGDEKNIDVTLTRPFAQINFGTNDADLAAAAGISFSVSRIEEVTATFATQYDALAEVGSKVKKIDFKGGKLLEENLTVAGTDYKYLAAAYVLLPNKEKSIADVMMSINTGLNDNIIVNVPNAPVQRNYRTNVIGSLLTDNTNFDIVLDSSFENEHDIILSGNVTLNEDLKLNSPLIVPAGEEAVLNLNGHSIINANESEEFGAGEAIVAYGKLTIEGEGLVQAKSMAVWARGTEGADVTINGGTFVGMAEGLAKGGRSVIYASSNNTITINGGTFEALVADMTSYANNTEGVYAALNIADNNGNIVVKGGKFVKFNPAAPGTEPKKWNEAHPNGFVANGYGVVEKQGSWYVVPQIVSDLYNVTEETTVAMTETLNVSANTTIHTQKATANITINGNGNSVVSVAESANDFQWENGSIPAMSTIFSSEKGSKAKVTVSDLTFKGTMSAIMLGHYVDANSNWYNTELNNVKVIDTKVVSFSQNIAPAVCVYGTATLNNCNIYGTTLSELDTDPMWPVYDVAVVNYSNTTVNGGKIGSMFVWNQADVVIDNGAEVDTIVVRGNMNTTKYGITIKAGTTVGIIDLSAITNNQRVNFTIENGANVGRIVANGKEYVSIDHFMGKVTVTEAATKDAVEDVLADGGYVTLTSDIAVAKSEADDNDNGYGAVGISQLNGGTIDGNGNAISVDAWGTWDSAINTTGGTIKNLNVTGGMRGIFVNHNSTHSEKVVLDNVTIDGTVYTISCDQGTNMGLEAYNSTFNGWTSYAATIGAVKFTNCSFGEGQGYAFCRPYAATEFVGCAFAAGYELDACAAVTFENCTIGGVALTAENLSTLVGGGIANATVK